MIIFGTFPFFANTSNLLIVSSLPTTSERTVGRYFSTLNLNKFNYYLARSIRKVTAKHNHSPMHSIVNFYIKLLLSILQDTHIYIWRMTIP